MNLLTLSVTEPELFNTEGVGVRDINTVWAGKGSILGFVGIDIPNQVEITYEYPKTREELAKLLKRSIAYYTTDCNSNLGVEARLCGCPMVFLVNDTYSMDDLKRINGHAMAGIALNPSPEEIERARKELPLYPAQYEEQFGHQDEQIDEFIRITQNMKPLGAK